MLDDCEQRGIDDCLGHIHCAKHYENGIAKCVHADLKRTALENIPPLGSFCEQNKTPLSCKSTSAREYCIWGENHYCHHTEKAKRTDTACLAVFHAAQQNAQVCGCFPNILSSEKENCVINEKGLTVGDCKDLWEINGINENDIHEKCINPL